MHRGWRGTRQCVGREGEERARGKEIFAGYRLSRLAVGRKKSSGEGESNTPTKIRTIRPSSLLRHLEQQPLGEGGELGGCWRFAPLGGPCRHDGVRVRVPAQEMPGVVERAVLRSQGEAA